MKYKDYISELEKLPHKSTDGRTLAEMFADSIDLWSNYACIGYAKIAAAEIGLDEATADKLIKAMYTAFDDYSVDEAEQHY